MDTHGDTLAIAPDETGFIEQPYHLPDPNALPIVGAFAGATMLAGIVLWAHFGIKEVFGLGVMVIMGVMFFWWRTVIRESLAAGVISPLTRLSLRYGMTLFITSEVMLFVSFFWTFFNFAIFPENVAGQLAPLWPPIGVHTFDPFSTPFLNTMILLLSGCTVTWAHHSLIEGDRRSLIMGLGLTILLGMSFTCLQIMEYSNAPFHFSGGGVYPAIFFIATGFHGAHVFIGTSFLVVCWYRSRAGQFTPTRHFGFEAAAWYWHFVDVVWLFLFICIYWWGAGPVAHE